MSFGGVAVAVVAAVPSFRIVSMPSRVVTAPGASFTITVEIVNGGADGDAELRLRDHRGSVVATAVVTVASGSSKTASLTAIAPSSEGTYTWFVEVYNRAVNSTDDSRSFELEVSASTMQQVLQLIMRYLPWILTIIMVLLIISALVSALR